MYYQEFPPSPILTPYVKCLWILESDQFITDAPEKILPDGCMELIFHYGAPFVQSLSQPKTFVYGQLHQAIEISPNGKTGILAVRFQPDGLSAFINMPGSEFVNRPATFLELFGNKGSSMEDQLLLCNNSEQRTKLMIQFLESQLSSHYGRYDNVINWCVKNIRSNNGVLDKNQFERHIGLSQRQLERRFKNSVGLTIKRFAKITRFQHTLSLINDNEMSLTSLAHHAGYYDQAHFIKDFKEFAGINPKAYISTKHALSDLLVNGV